MKIVFIIILILIGIVSLSIIFQVTVFWLIKLGFLKNIKTNQDFLEHEMQQYGRELEKMNYYDLKEYPKQKKVVKESAGKELEFWFECTLEENEDLFVLIEMEAKNCNTFGVTPTYTFWKRSDGVVYHGEDVQGR